MSGPLRNRYPAGARDNFRRPILSSDLEPFTQCKLSMQAIKSNWTSRSHISASAQNDEIGAPTTELCERPCAGAKRPLSNELIVGGHERVARSLEMTANPPLSQEEN